MTLTGHLTRNSAFTIHLLASLILFVTLSALVVLVWYPSPLFQIDGGWQGLRIVAFVDVVLGPLLTLIVYRPGKPGLKFDMSVIIAFQVAALAWGIWTLHNNRPLLLVFADDHFRPIPAVLVDESDPSGKLAKRYADQAPARLMVDIPRELTANTDYVLSRIRTGIQLHYAHEDYVPLTERWQDFTHDSLDIRHFVKDKPQWLQEAEAMAASAGVELDDMVFAPIVGRYKNGVLAWHPETKELVGYLDWPFELGMGRKRYRLQHHVEAIKQGVGDTP